MCFKGVLNIAPCTRRGWAWSCWERWHWSIGPNRSDQSLKRRCIRSLKCNADGIIFDLNLIFEEAILDLRIDFNFKMQTKPDVGLDLRSGVKIYWRQKPDSACRQFSCVAGLSGIDSGHVSLVQPHLIYVQRGGVVVDLIPAPQSLETAKKRGWMNALG